MYLASSKAAWFINLYKPCELLSLTVAPQGHLSWSHMWVQDADLSSCHRPTNCLIIEPSDIPVAKTETTREHAVGSIPPAWTGCNQQQLNPEKQPWILQWCNHCPGTFLMQECIMLWRSSPLAVASKLFSYNHSPCKLKRQTHLIFLSDSEFSTHGPRERSLP